MSRIAAVNLDDILLAPAYASIASEMSVDAYCERTDPGLWGEPLNAVSNAGFLLASAILLWLIAGQRRRVAASVWVLPVLLGVVGLCSLSFHLFATEATAALDSGAIAVFILCAVVITTRWMWGVRWRWAWLAAPAYLAASVGFTAAVVAIAGERAALGGYLPALLGLIGFGTAIRLTARSAAVYGRWLLAASGIFGASLTLRTLDEPLCGTLPIGTHFLWHCLNAVVLFIVSYAVLRRWHTASGVPNKA